MRIRCLGLSLLLLAVSTFAEAQGTRLWKQSSFPSFEKGTPHGVAIGSDGNLSASAAPVSVVSTNAAYIWSTAADSNGNVYLGTGSPARVLQVSPDGKKKRLFESKNLSVQVVRVGPDGMLYAATMPGGKVYRIDPNRAHVEAAAAAKANSANEKAHALPGHPGATVVFDSSKLGPKPTYIWDMAFDSAGRLYIATGDPAAIYRIDPKHPTATPEKFFSSDEQNIRSVRFGPNGILYAGSDPRGLVYRITPQGKAFVLFEAPKQEITAMAFDPKGNLYAAAVGDKGQSNLAPLDVHNQPTLTATIHIVTAGSQAASGPSLVPGGTAIYQIAPDGAPRLLWSSSDDVVYALAWRKAANGESGGLLAGSGNQGRLYRIHTDGTFADLAHLEAKQATAFAVAGNTAYVATSNVGKLYRLSAAGPAARSTYISQIHDAKFFSQWGEAETRASGKYELFARVGNVEQPSEGWSSWQNVTPGTSRPPLPKGRFLQWKAVLPAGARIHEVGFYYLPQNIAPVVEDIVVQMHARISSASEAGAQPSAFPIEFPEGTTNAVKYRVPRTAASGLVAVPARDWATVRWKAQDPNGDRLMYSVYERGDGEANWRPLVENLRRPYLSFDLNRIPDGGYTLRIVASDAPSNPPGKALTGYKDSGHFLVDTMPPVLSTVKAAVAENAVHVTFDARSKLSTVAGAYCSVDAGPWQYVEPVGRLSDSNEEHYDFTIPLEEHGTNSAPSKQLPAEVRPTAPRQHIVAIRVVDRTGNTATSKVSVESK
jgi:sugar lactone lactonase YvrE